MNASTHARTAILYRMVMDAHVCPYGLKARDLLRRNGFAVDDRWLTTRAAVDAFKAEHGVPTTPQLFIDGRRIGGYDDLRRHLGKSVPDPEAPRYQPVIAVFALAALMALAVSQNVYATPLTAHAVQWFVDFSMVVLALLKLQNIETFSTMFLNYDLLAQRWVRYATLYPFAEALAGVLMIAGVLRWISIPLALVIGTVGVVSVFKAVYVDRRALKCACVGGSGNVPLGVVSLAENLMMVAMALWMLFAGMPAMPAAAHAHAPATQAAQAYMTGMERMSRDMAVRMSGDADRDFASMMIPHHQGAIDMSEVELRYGRDPMLRQMAGDVVRTQTQEIGQLRAWLALHPSGHTH